MSDGRSVEMRLIEILMRLVVLETYSHERYGFCYNSSLHIHQHRIPCSVGFIIDVRMWMFL